MTPAKMSDAATRKMPPKMNGPHGLDEGGSEEGEAMFEAKFPRRAGK